MITVAIASVMIIVSVMVAGVVVVSVQAVLSTTIHASQNLSSRVAIGMECISASS
jgi:hypothetical protein